MSRYADAIPTSHLPAYPSTESHKWSRYRPNQQEHPYQQAGPSSRPWGGYGPPPSVPASLYAAGYDPTHLSSHSTAGDASADWQEENERRRYTQGRDYLRSLGKGMAAMQIGRSDLQPDQGGMDERGHLHKPLPDLPLPPALLHRPQTDPSQNYRIGNNRHAASTDGALVDRSGLPSARLQSTHSSPKFFRPSPYLQLPELHRPKSDSAIQLSRPSGGGGGSPAVGNRTHPGGPATGSPSKPPAYRSPKQDNAVIDLTYSPASFSSSNPSTPPENVTPRSPARLKKSPLSPSPASAQRSRPSSKTVASPARPSQAGDGKAVQCAGFTRSGQPCKRLVRAEAPFLSTLDLNAASSITPSRPDKGSHIGVGDEVGGRYCKDHAGMICSAAGFYSRDKPGTWVAFEDWLPPELGAQTQTVLRMTMESKLTAKESAGFIYAYELRDLQTPSTSWYKVGRTDNVPRRIGQWTNQCTSKSPTLRDIFPLPSSRFLPASPGSSSSPLKRNVTLTKSFLPGAVSSGTLTTTARTPLAAVKRWERLIHLELADLAARTRPDEWGSESVKGKCTDCGVVHREIFPVPRSDGSEADRGTGDGSYEVIVEIICRWERFVQFAYV